MKKKDYELVPSFAFSFMKVLDKTRSDYAEQDYKKFVNGVETLMLYVPKDKRADLRKKYEIKHSNNYWDKITGSLKLMEAIIDVMDNDVFKIMRGKDIIETKTKSDELREEDDDEDVEERLKKEKQKEKEYNVGT